MASSITTGRFTIASNARIAAFGMLMIGTLATDPYGPGFVIVNVAPWTSSGRSCVRARARARSAIARASPRCSSRRRPRIDRDDQPGVVARPRSPC